MSIRDIGVGFEVSGLGSRCLGWVQDVRVGFEAQGGMEKRVD
jgi:hypothetical protein